MDSVTPPKPSPAKRPSLPVLFVDFLATTAGDSLRKNVRIILRELDLFLGTALTIWGTLGFESDKYCDGNTADYLSCTRPSTYYYFDWLDITLVTLGVVLILLWVVKKRGK